MSPQPYPTIFGGLNEGIQTGMKMGLMKDKMQIRKDEQVRNQADDKRKELSSQISTGLALSANSNVPDSVRLPSLNGAITAYNQLYGKGDGTGIPTMTEWTSGFGQIAQKSLNILNDSKIPTGDKPQMIAALIDGEKDNVAVKPFFDLSIKASEDAIKGQQANVKRQAIPLLQKMKSSGYNSLTDEEKNQLATWGAHPHDSVAVGEASDQVDKDIQGRPDYMKYPDQAKAWENTKAQINGQYRKPDVQSDTFDIQGNPLGSQPNTAQLPGGVTRTRPPVKGKTLGYTYNGENYTISDKDWKQILKDKSSVVKKATSNLTDPSEIQTATMRALTPYLSLYGGKKVQQGGNPTGTPNQPTSKVLDEKTATSLLQAAGGDKAKARQLAKEQGYTF